MTLPQRLHQITSVQDRSFTISLGMMASLQVHQQQGLGGGEERGYLVSYWGSTGGNHICLSRALDGIEFPWFLSLLLCLRTSSQSGREVKKSSILEGGWAAAGEGSGGSGGGGESRSGKTGSCMATLLIDTFLWLGSASVGIRASGCSSCPKERLHLGGGEDGGGDEGVWVRHRWQCVSTQVGASPPPCHRPHSWPLQAN